MWCYYSTTDRSKTTTIAPAGAGTSVSHRQGLYSLPVSLLQLRNSSLQSSAVQFAGSAHPIDCRRAPQTSTAACTTATDCIQCSLCKKSLPYYTAALLQRDAVQYQAERSTAPQEPHSSQAGVGTSVLHRQGLCLQCNLSVESVPVSLQVWNPHRTL